VVAWGAEVAFYVTVYHRPDIGPPRAESIGRRCPVCRVPFAATTQVYRCPCGKTMHFEDAGGLQCAVLTGTAGCSCGRAITREPQYTYLMEAPHA
jgi:hypothetical protein